MISEIAVMYSVKDMTSEHRGFFVGFVPSVDVSCRRVPLATSTRLDTWVRLSTLLLVSTRFLGQCSSSAGGGDGGDGPQKKGDLMKAYRDFGLHSMFAGILVKEATQGDDRFSHENLYHGGKHFPRPME